MALPVCLMFRWSWHHAMMTPSNVALQHASMSCSVPSVHSAAAGAEMGRPGTQRAVPYRHSTVLYRKDHVEALIPDDIASGPQGVPGVHHAPRRRGFSVIPSKAERTYSSFRLESEDEITWISVPGVLTARCYRMARMGRLIQCVWEFATRSFSACRPRTLPSPLSPLLGSGRCAGRWACPLPNHRQLDGSGPPSTICVSTAQTFRTVRVPLTYRAHRHPSPGMCGACPEGCPPNAFRVARGGGQAPQSSPSILCAQDDHRVAALGDWHHCVRGASHTRAGRVVGTQLPDRRPPPEALRAPDGR